MAVGPAVSEFSPGDRVAVLYPSHFSTFEAVPSWCCIKLRDNEDFQTIASLLIVFATAIYALYDRAQLQCGETVLIHSAAGGVGMAAIQIAKFIGAEIFVTAGTEAKRKHLIECCGLKADHVFRSRDTSFLRGVLAATNQRGVDVVLNSLTGDLLHASWEACSKFGRFIELGKRDIVDGARLDVKVFERSTTFTAFDLSMLTESTSPAHHHLHQRLVNILLGDALAKSVLPGSSQGPWSSYATVGFDLSSH